ncbi:PEP-CTERM sorting domain-containing protein [Puniceicoccus vermicola]|uniref:PEP-CTERM sorting domain-containing protein n=1 Tax=Puniceicoccus vermicola TaxID=388746 RepID=A0A7X1B0P6_9BACT|nr:PEP-CTERM sorting domain-containing protein [Puniceicoccus vermicola]MBC2603434.1 PEP-CTERM sorting domain-containing protein [Puniceicoccus vermicola]
MTPKKTNHTRLPRSPLLSSTVCLLAAFSSYSLNAVDLIDSNTTSESWNTGADWSDGQPASAGKDYDTNGYLLRSPNTPTWNSTFPGDSLTIRDAGGRTGGALLIKSGTLVTENIFMGLGGVAAANANNGSNVQSTWNITNFTVLSESTSSPGDFAYLKGAYTGNHLTTNISNLLGSGHLSIGYDGPSSINYGLSVTDASGFSGSLNLNKGNLTLAANLTITSSAFSMASSDSTMILDNDLTVASFEFGASSVSSGTYSSSDLNTLLSTSSFSGAGSLTVVPEPSTGALLFGGACMLLSIIARRNIRYS